MNIITLIEVGIRCGAIVLSILLIGIALFAGYAVVRTLIEQRSK